MFGRLFGRRREEPPARDVRALAAPLAVPAVHVVLRDAPSRSYFGGDPSLPQGVPWPERDGRRQAFLARLSLAEMQRALPVPWLPDAGALVFFYDMDAVPWGYDPEHRGGWAVLHVPDLAEEVSNETASAARTPRPRSNVGFRRIDALPSPQRAVVRALDLSDRETDAYFALQDACFEGRPMHQVTGFPIPVQEDAMERECHLASHGVYCGDAGWRTDPRASELEPGAANWRLLLQVDSADRLRLLWGDLGRLYFWVEEPAARRGDFSNVWVILQCT